MLHRIWESWFPRESVQGWCICCVWEDNGSSKGGWMRIQDRHWVGFKLYKEGGQWPGANAGETASLPVTSTSSSPGSSRCKTLITAQEAACWSSGDRSWNQAVFNKEEVIRNHSVKKHWVHMVSQGRCGPLEPWRCITVLENRKEKKTSGHIWWSKHNTEGREWQNNGPLYLTRRCPHPAPQKPWASL